jgi:deoxycytidylate deaminase
MKVRIQVIVESDHGETECIEEVAQFERGELRPEALGMTLADAKALLQSVQQTMVTEQTTAYLDAHRPCPACQAPCRCKGHHQLV